MFKVISVSDAAHDVRVQMQLQAFRAIEQDGVTLSFVPSPDRKTATVFAKYPKGTFVLFVRNGFEGRGYAYNEDPEWCAFGYKGNIYEASVSRTVTVPFDDGRDYFVHIATWGADGKLIPILSKKYIQNEGSFGYYTY